MPAEFLIKHERMRIQIYRLKIYHFRSFLFQLNTAIALNMINHFLTHRQSSVVLSRFVVKFFLMRCCQALFQDISSTREIFSREITNIKIHANRCK